MEKSLNNFFKKTVLEPDITNGVCPMCEMPTMMVSLAKDTYRCMSCGSDLEQKINGVIKYMPITRSIQQEKPKNSG